MKSSFAIFSSLLVVLLPLTATSQWVQTNGPCGGIVQCLVVNGTRIFAGASHGRVYLSTDNGTSWTDVHTGMNGIGVYSLVVAPNAAGGTNLFAGMYDAGVFLSTNNGTSWSGASTGLPRNLHGGYLSVKCFAVSGSNLFAGTDGLGVYLSTNSGTNWTQVSPSWYVYSLAVSPNGTGGTSLYAGTYADVFVSTDNGTNWNQAGTGLTNPYVYSLAISPNGTGGTNLFAGTRSGEVFLLANDDTSWTAVDSGLTNSDVRALVVSPNGTGGTNLFAGTMAGVFLSTNNGARWSAVDTGLTETRILALAVSPNGTGGTNIFAGTYGSGVFLSTNDGTHWTTVNDGITDTDIWALAVSPNATGRGLPTGIRPDSVVDDSSSGTNVFAGTYDAGVFLSANNGISWTDISTSINIHGTYALVVSPNETGGTNIFAGTSGAGVFLSTDNGTSWTGASTGLPMNIFGSYYSIMCFGVSGSDLFAGTSQGVFLSSNSGTSWTDVSSNLTNTDVHALAVGTNETTGTILFAGTSGSVFRSSDSGASWSLVGPLGNVIISFAMSPNGMGGMNLFAGSLDNGVFLSTNDGTNWTSVCAGLTNNSVQALVVSSGGAGRTNLFAGTRGGGICVSPDNGTSWSAANSGLSARWVYALAVTDTILFAGTDAGVWRRPLSEMFTSVPPSSTDIPRKFSLEQNFPNPFNPETEISFQVPGVRDQGPGTRSVKLVVYDLLGREVATLVNEERPPGSYTVRFEASALASGVYMYRLIAGEWAGVRKMMLLK